MSYIPDRRARMVTGDVPVMRETRFDHTSSIVIAATLILIGTEVPRNSGRAVTKLMNSQSVHLKVPGGVAFVGAGRRSPTIM